MKCVYKSMIARVREFHEVFGVPIAVTPCLPPPEVEKLRIDLIEEEFRELKHAFATRNLVEVADALADLHYVITGTSLACGIPYLKIHFLDEVVLKILLVFLACRVLALPPLPPVLRGMPLGPSAHFCL